MTDSIIEKSYAILINHLRRISSKYNNWKFETKMKQVVPTILIEVWHEPTHFVAYKKQLYSTIYSCLWKLSLADQLVIDLLFFLYSTSNKLFVAFLFRPQGPNNSKETNKTAAGYRK